jgi:tetratricopeptide (TPR) repeat protein
MAAYIEGRFGDARPLLEQAVEAEPAAPDASFFLGVCHLQLGRPKEASTQFLRAIQLGPSLYLESAHFYLAKAHIQRNQLAEAEEELQAVLAGQGRRSAEADALLVRLRALRTALQEARTAPRTGQPPR